MLVAVGLAFVTPLLEAKGFQSVEIGWLNAVKYVSVIFFQIVIADFSDKHAHTFPLRWIMQIMGILGIIAAVLFWYFGHHFILTALIFILFGLTVNCLSPIVDSLSVQYMAHGRNFNYSISRATGSGCWAISCVLLGFFSDAFGVNNIILLQIGATVLFLLVTMMMDSVEFSYNNLEDTQEEGQSSHSVWHIVSNYPKYTVFLIACMLVFMGYHFNTVFLVDHIKALGGTNSDYGLAEFVLAIAEMPVAIFFVQLRKKISIDKMMLFCAIFCTLRVAAVAFAPAVVLVIASQILEIFGLGLFYPGCVYFVMENLPGTDVVKGVSFINVASVGIGETVASLFCGIIKEKAGLQELMIASIIVSFVSVVVMLVMVMMPKKWRGK